MNEHFKISLLEGSAIIDDFGPIFLVVDFNAHVIATNILHDSIWIISEKEGKPNLAKSLGAQKS